MTVPSWKQVELRVARYVGAERNPGSGASHTSTRSDSTHPLLFIETKHGKAAERLLRSRPRLLRLFADTERKACAEGKVPVVVLHPPRWGNGGVANYPAWVRAEWRTGSLGTVGWTVVGLPLSEVRRAIGGGAKGGKEGE